MIPHSIYMLFFVCFLLIRPNWAGPDLESSPNDTVTTAVEHTLKLTWNFTEIVGNKYNIFWEKDNQDIGRCQDKLECVKFPDFVNDTRIILTEVGRRSFQLRINNINDSDAGSYKCGYEDRDDGMKQYPLHQVDVNVTPKEEPSLYVSTTSKHSLIIGNRTPGDNQQEDGSQSSTQITVATEETGGQSGKIQPLPVESDIMSEESQASSIKSFRYMIYFCFTISTIALIFAAFALLRTFRSQNNNPDIAQDVEEAEETKKGATGTGTGVYDVIDPIVPSGTNNHVSILDNQEQETPFRYHLQNGLHRAHSEIRDGVAMNTSCPGPSVPKRRTQSEYKGHHSSDDYDHLHRKQMKKFSLPGDSLFALGIAEEDIDDNPINGPTCKSRSLNDAVKVDELVANPSCSRRGEEKMEKSSDTDSTTAGTKDNHNYHVLEKLSCPGPEEESSDETDGTVNGRANNNDPTKLEYDPGYDNLRSAKGKNMTTRKYEEIDMSK